MTKVGFLGNCQAQTLEALALHLGADYEIVSFGPVWLYTSDDEDRVLSRALSCDILFHQRIAEDYGVHFLRTSSMKLLLKDKCLSWPNAYFDGYFPTFGYIYTNRGKITGPLSDYHLPIIREGWERGRAVEEVAAAITSPNSPLFADDPVSNSLSELRSRESGLDICMSDFIEENYKSYKTFFTPNHPCDVVLFELLTRLTRAAGLRTPSASRLVTFPYTLNSIQIPVMPAFFERYGGEIARDGTLRGREISLSPDSIGETGTPRLYDWPGVVDSYFRVYDAYAKLA
ncbi:WcbI family polysaccharide biosynthesis putative acetyltransferase [Methylobacterium isbiliense]|uniref:Polysaccharide biosynthesis enzyme WcbI domain-containing protein n=1 Tax=Methylobacterium isbiliense TaxID=315478 RepID=A0ABQ4SJF0_9HYPH|nr:WcbI family polysaccharide biosynthesis putative acetyltransferase [Methylobacterium isbiliense]MDN3625798.1 WcbI family polysaccharide biosynthesis putative acetyltransferase [Methylobacterium isbiliense]GJE02548.1 hypothetical protein GMJLKIPL_4497 [Methylobacterium isbiliense]